MIIVLEGFDTTGKSSLAHYLAHELDFYYMHSMPSYSRQLQIELVEELKKIKNNVVLDRFHLTDIVYGKVVCGHTRINNKQLEELEKYMLEREVIFMHCTANLDIVKERYQFEKNRYVPFQLISSCLNEYKKQFLRLRKKGFVVFEINTSLPFDEQKKYVDQIIKDIRGI